jgi:hypothetical protein
MPLLLTIHGRHNFENLSRYGSFNETTYRARYEKGFDFARFNEQLILSMGEEERIIAFDPSYLPKSGKRTPGTGYFWSGCANATKYGLEISGFASVGLESRTAMHLYAKQTIGQARYGSLLDYYAGLVVDQADRLRLNPAHFIPCLVEDKLVAYQGKVYVKALDRLVKCVIVHITKRDGSVRAESFFATDPTMDGANVLECYRLRLQRGRPVIEFLYRDAKQHTGLTECQARSESKIHTHVNASLTAVSLAKAVYAWPKRGQPRKFFSLSSIKIQYFNQHLLHRFLVSSG